VLVRLDKTSGGVIIISEDLHKVLDYHLRTKHHPRSMARGPAGLDFANQPDPFRRYIGAPQFCLEKKGLDDPMAGQKAPASVDMRSISVLFFESLAISAWKSFAGSKWSLRVNPSSGNLHPAESYLVACNINGLAELPAVYHYSPKEHALERRYLISPRSWQALNLPEGTLLVALTSIYWREAWKYGERAFRYCMIDVGHAAAAVATAAACLGWQTSLQDEIGTQDLVRLLGISSSNKSNDSRFEVEHPDCLLAIFTDGDMHRLSLPAESLLNLEIEILKGSPSPLSPKYVDWPAIEQVSKATSKPFAGDASRQIAAQAELPSANMGRVLRTRRSAQAMDGKTNMPKDIFYDILAATLPEKVPLSVLPWKVHMNMVLFVHRVLEMERGLYIFLRDKDQMQSLRIAMHPDFTWEKPAHCPEDLGLYLLAEGDAGVAAKRLSCNQDLASDGCFAAAMIAWFMQPLQERGPWFYSRLHWECGIIGQALYLSAEAAGFNGCGIGCFFDDEVHRMLGLEGLQFQDLYHFTVGKALKDPRLIDLPAYD
jgi:SagB-type dehydrogenase family enzyme